MKYKKQEKTIKKFNPNFIMKILELFAGSRSISKEAEKLGMETFSAKIPPDLCNEVLTHV